MDQINERRSRQALAKKAKEEAVSTARGADNNPQPVKVIGKRPPLKVVREATKTEETVKEQPVTEATVTEPVVKEETKPVATKQPKETKKQSGGRVAMTKDFNTVFEGLLTKVKGVDVRKEDYKAPSLTIEDKGEILAAILKEYGVDITKTRGKDVVGDFEKTLASLVESGYKFNFAGATARTVKGCYVHDRDTVSVRKAVSPTGDPSAIKPDETHYVLTRQNGFRFVYGFGEKEEIVKGKLSEDGKTFIAKDGRTFLVAE